MVTRAKTNLQTVTALIASLDLDEAGAARASIARTLAKKLDELAKETTATESLAVAGIAKGLREVLEELVDSAEGEDGFNFAESFAKVGDTSHA